MPPAPTDLLYGTIDVLVLKTLSWRPMHGYAISEWIQQHTSGALQLDDAALYKSMHRLEAQGLVEGAWGLSDNNRRARFYQLTDAGEKQLRARSTVWRDYAHAVFKVLDHA